MKQQGSELGSLASKFFAYTQLKKKEIVRTGELSPVLEITPAQEPEFFTGAGKNAKLHPRWITCRFKVLFTVFCKPGHEDRAERI